MCDWHGADGTTLPAEYAEWAQQNGVPAPVTSPLEPRIVHAAAVSGDAGAAGGVGFRILSPQEGDVYRVPAGVDRRYATVALRAAGGSARRPVRWLVDGQPFTGARWALQPGRHRIRALDGSGAVAEVGVEVE